MKYIDLPGSNEHRIKIYDDGEFDVVTISDDMKVRESNGEGGGFFILEIKELNKVIYVNKEQIRAYIERDKLKTIANSMRNLPALQKGQFLIASVCKKNGNLNTSESHRIHLNIDDAREESERLAMSNSSKKYIILQVRGICSNEGLVWE